MTPTPYEHTLAEQISEFLRDQFPVTAGDVDHHTDLFDAGIVDSVGVTETIAWLEATYQVRIPDEALLSDEFTTIAGIARVIAALQATAAAAP